MRVDAHHHLWDLGAVRYPWLMERGARRFFGDPAPIQRDYLLGEFRRDAAAAGFGKSVHIQVGAEDPFAEAEWIDGLARGNADWPMVQVPFCDLIGANREAELDRLQGLSSVVGVRQLVARAPWEEAPTATDTLLGDPAFLDGLKSLGTRGLSFDLQLIPEVMGEVASLLALAPDTSVALCHAGSPHDRSSGGLARWAEALRSMSDLPQVVCKLSGLGMFERDWTAESVRPIVETCLEQFGPERCMFGSNFPVDSLTSDFAKLVSAYEALLPADVQDQVFRGTAGAFYFRGR